MDSISLSVRSRSQPPCAKRVLRGWPARSERIVWPAASVGALALLQECLARTGTIDARRFPPVTAVLQSLVDEVASGRLWTPLAATLGNWAVSLVLAFVLALALAVVLSSFRWLRELTAPILSFLRPMPCTALIPLVILTLGANARGAIFLTTFGALWQMLPGLAAGIGQRDRVALDTARVFGYRRRQIFFWLTLRSLEPHMLTALRIGATASLVLLISMEMLTGSTGIGRNIALAYAGSNASAMYAYVLLSGVLGTLINVYLNAIVAQRAPYFGGKGA